MFLKVILFGFEDGSFGGRVVKLLKNEEVGLIIYKSSFVNHRILQIKINLKDFFAKDFVRK